MSSAPVRAQAASMAAAVAGGNRPHTAFALDRLHDDGRRVVVNERVEARDVRGIGKDDLRNQRLKRPAIVFVPRHRQRAHGAPVE